MIRVSAANRPVNVNVSVACFAAFNRAGIAASLGIPPIVVAGGENNTARPILLREVD
jgi:hypothetical protein